MAQLEPAVEVRPDTVDAGQAHQIGPFVEFFRRDGPLSRQEQLLLSTLWLQVSRKAKKAEQRLSSQIALTPELDEALSRRNKVRTLAHSLWKTVVKAIADLEDGRLVYASADELQRLKAKAARLEQIQHRTTWGDFNRVGEGLETIDPNESDSTDDSDREDDDDVVVLDSSGRRLVVSASHSGSVTAPGHPNTLGTAIQKPDEPTESESADALDGVESAVENTNADTNQLAPRPSTGSAAKSKRKTGQKSSERQKRPRLSTSNVGLLGRISAHTIKRSQRALTELEDPLLNPKHESHLYSAHGLLIPDSSKDRKVFALDDFSFFKDDRMVDLLEVDNASKWADPSRYRLEGLTNLLWDSEQTDLDEFDNPDLSFVGWRRVVVSGHDLLGMAPSLEGLRIDTSNARYYLLSPAGCFVPYMQRAKAFLNYFAFARARHVRGQVLEGPSFTLRQLNSAIAGQHKQGGIQSTLSPPWDLGIERLEPLQAHTDTELVALLYKFLPDTPFVTPTVYDLVTPFLSPGTLRTLESHDVMEHIERRRRDETMWMSLFALVDAEPGPAKLEIGTARESSFIEPALPLGVGRSIEVFDTVVIRGVAYRKGDTVLLAGSRAADDDIDGLSALLDHVTDIPDDDIEARQSCSGGSRSTPIGGVASSRALAYADHCETVDPGSIVSHVEIARIDAGERTPDTGLYYNFHWDKSDGSWQDAVNLEDTRDFILCDKALVAHCASCERRQKEFALSQEDPEPTASDEDPARIPHPLWLEEGKTFIYDDEEYHIHDFVYISPSVPDRSKRWRQPFRLGQLMSIDEEDEALNRDSRMTIRWMVRADDLIRPAPGQGRDGLRLISTAVQDEAVELHLLRGSFNVMHFDDAVEEAIEAVAEKPNASDKHDLVLTWLSRQTNVFHCGERLVHNKNDVWSVFEQALVKGNPPSKPFDEEYITRHIKVVPRNALQRHLKMCAVCRQKRERRHEAEKEALALVPRLRCLTVYAGADLYGVGLEQGCPLIETKDGVELDPIASRFFSMNRPQARAHNESVSDFLERALTKQSVPGKIVPPGADEVDMIFGGPPCQSFSRANLVKKTDDLRSAEPWVFLACMDHWRPLFASFENVREIQRFVLPDDTGSLLLNLVIEVLLELGYQVRPAVLQAAHYGTPQTRRRVILTIARQGLTLPEAPQPTHAFTDLMASMDPFVFDGSKKGRPRTIRHRDGHAPHHALDFWDAASDLPRFGFKDPFNHAIQNDEEGLQDWQWFFGIGFGRQEEYRSSPLSELQRASRFELKWNHETGKYTLRKAEGCDDHVVPSVSVLRASQLAHIRPRHENGASHNYEGQTARAFSSRKTTAYEYDIADIPETIFADGQEVTLRPQMPVSVLRNGRRTETEWFARLDWTDVVTPLRTFIAVDGVSHGRRIHPESARQISVREAARCQGFSDLDSWSSSDTDDVSLAAAYRMIGNAVPRPMGAALGRCLTSAIVSLVADQVDKGEDLSNLWQRLHQQLSSGRLRVPRNDKVISDGEHRKGSIDLHLQVTTSSGMIASSSRLKQATDTAPRTRRPGFNGFAPPRWIVSLPDSELIHSEQDVVAQPAATDCDQRQRGRVAKGLGSSHTAQYKAAEQDDEFTPYGPTLRRRGNVAFVKAQGLSASSGNSSATKVLHSVGHSRGVHVKGLYESIVGTPTPPPQPAPKPTQAPQIKIDVDLTADEHDEDESSGESVESDAEVIIVDSQTGQQLPYRDSRPTTTAVRRSIVPANVFATQTTSTQSRVPARAIHEMLPKVLTPLKLPPNYHLRPNNVGWQLLSKQGWQEGDGLGVPEAKPENDASDEERKMSKRLKVPLRGIEKHDRRGLGLDPTKTATGARKTRAELEAELKRIALIERDRRGKGERGMAMKKKKEMQEHKAMMSYMNRD
ncbi:hypothetical protein OIO90_005136 [Microbotryomycetes sp. JL221]|nr:hypothetical protein OIO90_005136 [Microbotryomycetes sp. JL221]